MKTERYYQTAEEHEQELIDAQENGAYRYSVWKDLKDERLAERGQHKDLTQCRD